MMHNMDTAAPGARPLHIRIRDERKRRMKDAPQDWTQEAVAERAEMSLRAYGMFENGQSTPQGDNLRAILRVFGMDEAGEAAAEATRESWSPDIHVFLDMMGAFLSTMPEAERLAFMHDATRWIVGYRE